MEKTFTIRLEEETITAIKTRAEAEQERPSAYARTLLSDALQHLIIRPTPEVREALEYRASEKNLSVSDYASSVLFDALNEEPSVDEETLRLSVAPLQNALAKLHVMTRTGIHALLLAALTMDAEGNLNRLSQDDITQALEKIDQGG